MMYRKIQHFYKKFVIKNRIGEGFMMNPLILYDLFPPPFLRHVLYQESFFFTSHNKDMLDQACISIYT
ncbi:hypothetical protein RIF29_43236 [Crotalaria pallida]|uniref:Uncharacterized protein n=1 Tax=Crotalaria pallida TaxID=3830 RepID=A0AAN9DZZ2_CROPI